MDKLQELANTVDTLSETLNQLQELLIEITEGTDVEQILKIAGRPIREMNIGQKISMANTLLKTNIKYTKKEEA